MIFSAQAGVLVQHRGADLLPLGPLPPDRARRPRALVPRGRGRARPRPRRGLGLLLGQPQGLGRRPLAHPHRRQRGAGRSLVSRSNPLF